MSCSPGNIVVLSPRHPHAGQPGQQVTVHGHNMLISERAVDSIFDILVFFITVHLYSNVLLERIRLPIAHCHSSLAAAGGCCWHQHVLLYITPLTCIDSDGIMVDSQPHKG